jgi:putative spermidine/putrescine transport system permease protein
MLRVFSYLVVGVLLAPLLVILATSFTTLAYVAFPPVGFTLNWYVEALNRWEFVQSFYLSVEIALPTAVITTALGLPAAVGIVRYRFPGRDLANAFLLSPLILPTIVIGIAILQFYNRLSVGSTFAGLILGHVVITLPYAVRLIASGITGLDPNVEWAAQSLGAAPIGAFMRVTVPVVFPAILAGAIFAFITSFDDVTMSLFLATPQMVTLPVRIFAFWDQPIVPWLIAICSIVIVWTIIPIVIIERAVSIRGLFGYGTVDIE